MQSILFQNVIGSVIKYLLYKGDTGSERVGSTDLEKTAPLSSETFSNVSIKSWLFVPNIG